jgi:hypothetical protein
MNPLRTLSARLDKFFIDKALAYLEGMKSLSGDGLVKVELSRDYLEISCRTLKQVSGLLNLLIKVQGR